MKRSTRSLLEELNAVSVKRDSESALETRASHLINSVANLMSLIRESYTPEQAADLERRMLSSLRSGNPAKFVRGIRKLRDENTPVVKFKEIDENTPEDE